MQGCNHNQDDWGRMAPALAPLTGEREGEIQGSCPGPAVSPSSPSSFTNSTVIYSHDTNQAPHYNQYKKPKGHIPNNLEIIEMN